MSYSKCPRPMVVQTLIFSKQLYEEVDVHEWLEEKGFSARRVEETGVSYRARQHDPSLFVQGSLRTISMGQGASNVRAVVGCPIMSLWTQIQGERAERKALKASAKAAGKSLPPLRKPAVAPGWQAARRAAKSLGETLREAPPAAGTSLKAYARQHGLTLSSGDRRLWKGRKR